MKKFFLGFLFFIFLLASLISIKLLWFSESLIGLQPEDQFDSSSELSLINQSGEIEKTKVETVELIFGGDSFFDRHILQAIQKNGQNFVLGEMTSFLNTFDLVIINFESPITDNSSVSINSQVGGPNNYTFTSPAFTTEILNKNNISVVNLGNNHILNFGQDGLNQTLNYLQAAEIGYFGNVDSLLEPSYLIKEIRGLKIGFVNYNQFSSDSYMLALTDIEEIRSKVDVLVVYTHWGLEYMETANTVIQDVAHKLVDAGADLIIGTHPHVIQQHELYKDKNIYYSLGNFIFDQYFEEAVRTGLLVEVGINPETYEIKTQEHLVDIKSNGQLVLFNR